MVTEIHVPIIANAGPRLSIGRWFKRAGDPVTRCTNEGVGEGWRICRSWDCGRNHQFVLVGIDLRPVTAERVSVEGIIETR
jgi:hypothetical protein